MADRMRADEPGRWEQVRRNLSDEFGLHVDTPSGRTPWYMPVCCCWRLMAAMVVVLLNPLRTGGVVRVRSSTAPFYSAWRPLPTALEVDNIEQRGIGLSPQSGSSVELEGASDELRGSGSGTRELRGKSPMMWQI